MADRLYTDAELVVEECLKGPCAPSVTIRQLGGELDGDGLAVEGAPSFTPGDEVVVFLRLRRDGTYAPVGMSQGVLRLERTSGEVTYVRDTRGLILVERGRTSAGTVERVRARELRGVLGGE